MQLFNRDFQILLSAEQIQTRIQIVCQQLALRYRNRRPIFLAILNGSFMFAADVMKNMPIDCEISFVKLKSYEGDQTTGKVKSMIGLDIDLKGRDVIVLEDIVDTGETMLQFMPGLLNKEPNSVAIFTLLLKPKALRYPLHLDYVGFEIENEFVIGYGLDYDGLGRNFDAIYQCKS